MPDWAADVARDRDPQNDPQKTQKTQKAILFLGTLEPRKNIGGLLEAYRATPVASARRAAAGPGGRHPRLGPADAGGGRQDFAGGSHDTAAATSATLEKRRSLSRAAMLVLPSFEEGFGLPVLEAMACGVPVVVSNRGSLPEVAGDAATPVDPDDAEGLAREMARLLDATPLRTRPRVDSPGRRTSRGQAAPGRRETAYAAARRTRRSERRMKIAVDARELTGRPTGVGRYLCELLARWADVGGRRRHEWRLYAPSAPAVPGAFARAVRIVLAVAVVAARAGSSGAFRAHSRGDRPDVLFAPGYTAPLTAPCPTLVTIHDVSFAAHPEWFSRREGARRRTLTAWSARRREAGADRLRVLARRNRAAPRHPGGEGARRRPWG